MNTSSSPSEPHVLPTKSQLAHAKSKLITSLPSTGHGEQSIQSHIQADIAPALNKPSQSPHYYGFVTGSTTTAARLADNTVTQHDQNVQVHLPNETICTSVEDAALRQVCDLLSLPSQEFTHRTFTTGATASNIIGLACGRDYVLSKAAAASSGRDENVSVANDGIIEAMRKARLERIQILTTVPHSSLRKAASIVGLGRSSVVDVSHSNIAHHFDFAALETALSAPKTASILAVSCAEVNTGFFATTGQEMRRLRDICDRYGTWLHVDAAFGLLARLLPDKADYEALREGVAGLELADSITADAHKLLNVPYDCGIYLSRHLAIGTSVFQNANAAYLSSSSAAGGVDDVLPSPLNIGIENSRRFRALPVYATLAAYGRDGYRDMIIRQIGLAREIAAFLSTHADYELLNGGGQEGGDGLGRIYIIVLFRAVNAEINAELVKRINSTRRIYVSGTQWQGQPAARFAIASWAVDVERDFAVVKEVLDEAVKQ